MIRKPITIGISSGLEARPIALLVQVASQYSSNIYLESEEKKVNAKSIMGMMCVAAPWVYRWFVDLRLAAGFRP